MNFKKKRLIFRPEYFIFQWHITESCNWRCKHCYQEWEQPQADLSLDQLLAVFEKYLQFIKYAGVYGKDHTRLTLTGGEPLVRDDFFLFLEKIYPYTSKNYFFLSLLTNGSMIDEKNAIRLKKLGVRAVQVSLEGMLKYNDHVRGSGAFEKTLRSIKILNNIGIMTCVSFTLTKENILEAPKLIKLCEKKGVRRLGFRRFVPLGQGKEEQLGIIEPRKLREFYAYVERRQKGLQVKKAGLTLIRGCEEGIFAQEVDYPVGACAVVEGRCLVVLANGDLVPCRRLPIKLGNALKDDLRKIYYDSDILSQIRDLNNAHSLCKSCDVFENCLSGARCVSFAYFNSLFAPDPQCWRLFKKIPARNKFSKRRAISGARHRICNRLFGGTSSVIPKA
ncbi:MAG: radical SAM protein [Candidatus Omnitrophica bacterium]|nr:radical SAM protein [Candidatus Omnitrophota bacterium]